MTRALDWRGGVWHIASRSRSRRRRRCGGAGLETARVTISPDVQSAEAGRGSRCLAPPAARHAGGGSTRASARVRFQKVTRCCDADTFPACGSSRLSHGDRVSRLRETPPAAPGPIRLTGQACARAISSVSPHDCRRLGHECIVVRGAGSSTAVNAASRRSTRRTIRDPSVCAIRLVARRSRN